MFRNVEYSEGILTMERAHRKAAQILNNSTSTGPNGQKLNALKETKDERRWEKPG